MSKTDKLWQAIGDIDDSFVVEASAKRPKVLQGHWGLAASVACFCLVIASVVFMRGVGLLTPATQPTEPTTVPVTSTQPPETTKETAPPIQTVPHNTLPTPELQMYNDLFSDPYGWYNAALRCEYASPGDISLLMLFNNGFDDESRKGTDEEWAQLKDKEGFTEGVELFRLPVHKMNAILTELFGITVADVNPEGFEGMTYLESTDCWYYQSGKYRRVDFNALDVKPTLTGTKVYYEGGIAGNMVVTVTPNGADGYRILSNLPISAEEKTDMERVSELFNESGSWYNRTLMSQFAAPQKLQLREFFQDLEGVPTHELTTEEWAIFGMEKVPEVYRMVRLKNSMVNELLTQYFGVTVEQMSSYALEGMTYLESTDCWYFVTQGWHGDVVVHVQSVSELPDGRMQVNYKRGDLDGGSPIYSMVLQPNGDGYRILCNFRADDEMQALREEFDALFGGLSRYCFALSNWYDSPEKVWLRGLFETGFQGEHEPTDEEWAQLKDVQGFNENYDFFRLPVSKMNEVLMQYFGITLDQMDASAFDGLTYLKSTDCWYYMATGAVGINGFRTQLVEYPPDGTIRVYYISNYKDGVGVVTLQPYGDGYRILSNLPADTTVPTTKPTMPETEVMQDIEKAWKKRTGEELEWYTDNLWVGMRYYGSYDGYEILFYPTESVTDMFAELTVGGCSFWHSDTFEIYAYRDGKFRTLLDAYDSGDISGDSVAAIYEIHKPFEKL